FPSLSHHLHCRIAHRDQGKTGRKHHEHRDLHKYKNSAKDPQEAWANIHLPSNFSAQDSLWVLSQAPANLAPYWGKKNYPAYINQAAWLWYECLPWQRLSWPYHSGQ